MEYHLPKKASIADLTIRDGFQSEQKVMPAEAKLFIIRQLVDAGFKEMEVSAFAPPKYQPQFRDWEEVVKGLPDREDVIYSYVATGRKATQRALEARDKGYRIDRILMGILPASERFNKTVMGMNYPETWQWIEETCKGARERDIIVNVFLTGIFSPPDPQEGGVDLAGRALEFMDRLFGMGVNDIEHPDHMGEAAPHQVYEYFGRVFDKYPDPGLHIFHVHDARGMGQACYLAALHSGVTRFETALGGLGGWPANFVDGVPVPGLIGLEEVSRRPGLVSTEDFAVMLDAMGIETGVDLNKLMDLGKMTERIVGRRLWSMCPGTAELSGSGPVPKVQEYKTENR
ncbi:MAG: pyruvate carboxyltransferase [Desulfobacteraceae bacterium]